LRSPPSGEEPELQALWLALHRRFGEVLGEARPAVAASAVAND
jgi:hypothetical protein